MILGFNNFKIRGIVLMLLSFSLLCLFVQGVVAQEGGNMQDEVLTCSALLSQEEVDRCYATVCESGADVVCAENILRIIAPLDVGFAMSVLQQLSQNPYFLLEEGEGYYLANIVGSSAFQSVDVARLSDSFLFCGSEFYRECYYGFVEAAMSVDGSLFGSTVADVATAICGATSERVSVEECYRAMGFVVMKHVDYVLDDALLACDSLQVSLRPYCYEGVFIEGSAVFFDSGGVRSAGFLVDNPLAPCDAVDSVYQESCYKSHGRYLIHFADIYSSDPVSICSDVGYYEAVCRQSVADVYAVMHSEDVQKFDVGGFNTNRSWFQKIIDFIIGLFL